MKRHYCRYCRREVPMLDEADYARVEEVHCACVEAVKDYRRTHNAPLSETPLGELYRPTRELIKEITGTDEFEIDEVLRRHRLSRWEK
jgi:hypothetical protein